MIQPPGAARPPRRLRELLTLPGGPTTIGVCGLQGAPSRGRPAPRNKRRQPGGAWGLRMPTTYIPKAGELERRWFVIDARGLVLGKLAAKAASVLAGKTKP